MPDLELIMIPVEKLVESQNNPQKMTPGEFNRLVDSISSDGFDEPLIVAKNDDGTYQIISGHHRFRACQILGYEEIPCIVKTFADNDQRTVKMVKANVLRGQMDAIRFTSVVNDLLQRHDREELEYMFGFSDRKAFERMYREIRAGLPEEIQKKLDATKTEIRTIDDLARILNKLFSEYGETLDYGFMWFTYGGQDQFYVQMDKSLKDLCHKLEDECKEKGLNINEVLRRVLLYGWDAKEKVEVGT